MKSLNSLKPIKFKKCFHNFQVHLRNIFIFFQIMFEVIKIFSTLECVRSFIRKS